MGSISTMLSKQTTYTSQWQRFIAMFALLAMAGDMGGALGPGLVGTATQLAGDSLQAGMLAGCIFPLVLVTILIVLGNRTKASRMRQ